jgi:hypothetical protein
VSATTTNDLASEDIEDYKSFMYKKLVTRNIQNNVVLDLDVTVSSKMKIEKGYMKLDAMIMRN